MAHNVEGNDKIFATWGSDLYLPTESTAVIENKNTKGGREEDHIPIKEVVFCTSHQYFEAVEKSGVKLPTYTYDLNPPQYIQDLRGLYGERPDGKLANRRAEEMLESAEKFDSVSTMFGSTFTRLNGSTLPGKMSFSTRITMPFPAATLTLSMTK